VVRHGQDISPRRRPARERHRRADHRPGLRRRPLHLAADQGAGGVVDALGGVGVVAGVVAP
jgi:hypothetical protein